MKSFFCIGLMMGIVFSMAACKPILGPVAAPTQGALDESALMQTSVARVTAEAVRTRPPAVVIINPTETSPNLPQITTNPPLPMSSEAVATPTPDLPCNWVQAGVPIDISVPDGSVFFPGQEFIKTWRIINGGRCTWTMLYKYSYYSGNSMGAHQENRLITEVLPGQAVDISVPFIAPFTAGEYEGSWMMQDEAGNFFGMGLNADAPFYVKIRVEASPTATTPNP